MIIDTPYGKITIDIPKIANNREIKNVAIKLSGGADSAILLYLAAIYVKTERPELNLIPLTFVNLQKPYQALFAPNVVQKVEDLTNVIMRKNHIIRDINGNQNVDEHGEIWQDLFLKKVFDYSMYGETMNPPPGSFRNDCSDGRVTERDEMQPIHHRQYSLRPLRNINKKGIRHLYELFDQKELFQLTHSCERVTLNIDKLKVHCGKCWWCGERKWAFTDWCGY